MKIACDSEGTESREPDGPTVDRPISIPLIYKKIPSVDRRAFLNDASEHGIGAGLKAPLLSDNKMLALANAWLQAQAEIQTQAELAS